LENPQSESSHELVDKSDRPFSIVTGTHWRIIVTQYQLIPVHTVSYIVYAHQSKFALLTSSFCNATTERVTSYINAFDVTTPKYQRAK
jgi:hypothetical protein